MEQDTITSLNSIDRHLLPIESRKNSDAETENRPSSVAVILVASDTSFSLDDRSNNNKSPLLTCSGHGRLCHPSSNNGQHGCILFKRFNFLQAHCFIDRPTYTSFLCVCAPVLLQLHRCRFNLLLKIRCLLLALWFDRSRHRACKHA